MTEQTAAKSGAKAARMIRAPRAEDGPGITRLIENCPPLEANSAYSTLLLATHFARTCRLAEGDNGEPVAWVSGYMQPDAPDTYFLWQVAVGEEARGEGLGKRLILDILASNDARRLHATVEAGNDASWGLFRSVAKTLDAPIVDRPHFLSEEHFGGDHETEYLADIGPIDPDRLAAAAAG